MSRYLFAIPHYYTDVPASDLGSECEPREERAKVVARTITALHETFGRSLSVRPAHRSPDTSGHVVDVVVVTTRTDHLLADIGESAQLIRHVVVDEAPMTLGFAAHRILGEALGRYDRYGYMEDDLIVHDPLLFAKQEWFTSTFGPASLLAPTRYESSGGLKVHPDGPLPDVATAALQRPLGRDRLEGDWFGLHLTFERPSNPHSGCFFVENAGLERLCAHPGFGVPHTSIVRTLETAATGPVTETFCVYKASPSCSDFLEVEHQGSRYLGQWGTPDPVHVVEALRVAAEVRADAAEAHAIGAERQLAEIRASRSWRLTAPLRRLGRLARRFR